MKRDEALLQGLAIIEAQYKLILSEVNEFYREAGLSGQLSPESEEIKETVSLIQSEFVKAIDGKDWYATPQGVKRNALLLGLLIAFSISATITKSVAVSEDAVLVWRTMGDTDVCEFCAELEFTEYEPGTETPPLPLHLGCRCWFELWLK